MVSALSACGLWKGGRARKGAEPAHIMIFDDLTSARSALKRIPAVGLELVEATAQTAVQWTVKTE
jgi:hypothetical protein